MILQQSTSLHQNMSSLQSRRLRQITNLWQPTSLPRVSILLQTTGHLQTRGLLRITILLKDRRQRRHRMVRRAGLPAIMLRPIPSN